MDGPSHYRAAEQLTEQASSFPDATASDVLVLLSAASVHATLALAAATALPAVNRYTGSNDDDRAWCEVTS